MSYTKDAFWADADGLQRIKDNDTYLYGLLDSNDNVIVPCRYSSLIHFDDECRLAAVERGGRWGYINKYGREVVPCEYSHVSDRFYCGRAEIRRYGSSGFINCVGDIVIPCEYDEVSIFWDDMASVKRNGKWGIINTTGHLRWGFTYDEISVLGGGLVVAGKRSLMGFGSIKYCLFDYSCHQLTDYKYDAIGNQVLSNGRVLFKRGTTKGYLDLNGNEIPLFG